MFQVSLCTWIVGTCKAKPSKSSLLFLVAKLQTIDLLRGLKSEKFGANTKKSWSGASAVGGHGWWQGAGSLGVNESGS